MAWPPAQHTTVPTTTPVGTGIPPMRLTTMAATRNQARARSTTDGCAGGPQPAGPIAYGKVAPTPGPTILCRLARRGRRRVDAYVGDTQHGQRYRSPVRAGAASAEPFRTRA